MLCVTLGYFLLFVALSSREYTTGVLHNSMKSLLRCVTFGSFHSYCLVHIAYCRHSSTFCQIISSDLKMVYFLSNQIFKNLDHSWPIFLTANLIITFLLMTGFELLTSELEATPLPTESQPLPIKS